MSQRISVSVKAAEESRMPLAYDMTNLLHGWRSDAKKDPFGPAGQEYEDWRAIGMALQRRLSPQGLAQASFRLAITAPPSSDEDNPELDAWLLQAVLRELAGKKAYAAEVRRVAKRYHKRPAKHACTPTPI